MKDVVLDSGALTMWAANDPRITALLDACQRDGRRAYVPTVCLVESLTGSARDEELNRRLKNTRSVTLDQSDARSAAARRSSIDGTDAADPVVVATAARLDAIVITTDPTDIRQLAGASLPTVQVIDPRD